MYIWNKQSYIVPQCSYMVILTWTLLSAMTKTCWCWYVNLHWPPASWNWHPNWSCCETLPDSLPHMLSKMIGVPTARGSKSKTLGGMNYFSLSVSVSVTLGTRWIDELSVYIPIGHHHQKHLFWKESDWDKDQKSQCAWKEQNHDG